LIVGLYSNQYQVTYSASGNVVSVAVPTSEWIDASGSATGIFPVQVTVGGSRSNFVSDNRTSITEPILIVGLYSNQYQVTYSASGNVVSVAVPTSEWIDASGSATGIFPVQVTLAVQEATLSVITVHQLLTNFDLASTVTSIK